MFPLSRISRDEETFSARRNSVSSSSVVGNELNSTGFTKYSETIRTITDIMMSAAISRSSRNAGSGVISATTIASTASGTAISLRAASGEPAAAHLAVAGAAMAFAGVISAWQPPIHEFEDVGQDLRHRAVEMRRDFLPDIHGFV